jgi:hypothetical protein
MPHVLSSISKWRDPAVINQSNTNVYVTQNSDGLASVLCVKTDNSLVQWTQDPQTSKQLRRFRYFSQPDRYCFASRLDI